MNKTCGELLVELLEGYGVDTVFGIPGVHTVELYRGLPSTSIRHITPRHEQGAGFMADGYARVTGKPGVCFIITGPGMTNIMTAMAQAAADSIPMLVISSVNRVAATGSHEGHLHELHDQQGMVAKVAAFSKTIWQPSDLSKVLAEAFAVFNSQRPQPVHIQIPTDVITADASEVVPQIAAMSQLPVAHPEQLDVAIQLMREARHPVLLYGGGCVDTGVDAQRLAEAWDAPTMMTINAKGLLPPSHPLSLGSNQSLPAARELIKSADVVLAIGTELGETDYDVVFDGGFDIQGQLIRIDCDARQLTRPFTAQVAILSDAKAAISGLYQRLKDAPCEHDAATTVATIKQQLIAQFPDSWAAQVAILQCIRETLTDVIIVGDSTQPVYSGNHGYEALATRRWFNSSTGYGTLGYALPAAIGAAVAAGIGIDANTDTGTARPDHSSQSTVTTATPVLCLIGDGGIQFTLSELICAAELELPLIVLIWNNQGYGEIRRYMKDRDLPLIGVNIKTPDFELLARGLGAGYRRIDSQQQLQQALLVDSQGWQPVVYEIDEFGEFVQQMAAEVSYFG